MPQHTLRAEGSFDRDFVVVDSGSTDPTIEIARSHGARVVELAAEDFDYSKALNIGVDQKGRRRCSLQQCSVGLPSQCLGIRALQASGRGGSGMGAASHREGLGDRLRAWNRRVPLASREPTCSGAAHDRHQPRARSGRCLAHRRQTPREATGYLVRDSRAILALDESPRSKLGYLAEHFKVVCYYVADFARPGTTAEHRREV